MRSEAQGGGEGRSRFSVLGFQFRPPVHTYQKLLARVKQNTVSVQVGPYSFSFCIQFGPPPKKRFRPKKSNTVSPKKHTCSHTLSVSPICKNKRVKSKKIEILHFHYKAKNQVKRRFQLFHGRELESAAKRGPTSGISPAPPAHAAQHSTRNRQRRATARSTLPFYFPLLHCTSIQKFATNQ